MALRVPTCKKSLRVIPSQVVVAPFPSRSSIGVGSVDVGSCRKRYSIGRYCATNKRNDALEGAERNVWLSEESEIGLVDGVLDLQGAQTLLCFCS